MDSGTKEIIFKPKAIKSITAISKYIAEKGYPENSKKFAAKLYDFGYSLAVFPNKYPICRFQNFAKRNLHCAVFEGNYIFTYKVVNDKLIIYNVIHSKRLK